MLRWRNLLWPIMISLWGTSASAEDVTHDEISNAIHLATSWPADLQDLPFHAGNPDTSFPYPKPEFLRAIGLELHARWYGRVSIHSRYRAPDHYTVDCVRVGDDLLGYVRQAVAEGDTPEGVLFVFSSIGEREIIAAMIPEDAEAAMLCKHVYRVDGNDRDEVMDAITVSLGKWFTDLRAVANVNPHPDWLLAKGWKGDQDSGVAQLEVRVHATDKMPGKIDIRITNYSWRLHSNS